MQNLPLTLFVILISIISARSQDTTWFDRSWQKIDAAKNASYFRTSQKTDSGWLVTDHYRDGKRQMTGVFSDDSLRVRRGVFKWFNEDGKTTHLCTYAENKAAGPEIVYYDNGREQIKGGNKANERDGQWIGFYPSGKLSGKATYKDGKQIAVTLYNEDGSLNKTDTVFQRDSEFAGGIGQYLRFLNKTLRYPDSAIVYERQGTVVIKFKVTKEGKATDFEVVRSVDKDLDAEAMRVLRMMPLWEPAIIAGIRSDSYHMQPVVFNLGSK